MYCPASSLPSFPLLLCSFCTLQRTWELSLIIVFNRLISYHINYSNCQGITWVCVCVRIVFASRRTVGYKFKWHIEWERERERKRGGKTRQIQLDEIVLHSQALNCLQQSNQNLSIRCAIIRARLFMSAVYVWQALRIRRVWHSLITLHSRSPFLPRCTCAAFAKCLSKMCENSYKYFRLKLSVLSHSVVIVIVYVSLPASLTLSLSL